MNGANFGGDKSWAISQVTGRKMVGRGMAFLGYLLIPCPERAHKAGFGDEVDVTVDPRQRSSVPAVFKLIPHQAVLTITTTYEKSTVTMYKVGHWR